MSGYRYFNSPLTALELSNLLKQTSNIVTFRKIQSIYLRVKFNYLPDEIAKIVGLSTSRVRHIHSDYKKYGKEFLTEKKRGGRNHSYASIEEEAQFLETLKKKAIKGSIVEVRGIHKAYESFINRKIHKSMIYKLLHRHGWRKLSPRPHHPNQNREAIETFKKTFPVWLPKHGK